MINDKLYLMVVTLLVLGAIALVICLAFMVQGPPYTASDEDSIKKMLRLIKPYKPKHIMDMGSGNGKLVIRLAEAGYHVDGIELNPVLVIWSLLAVKKRNLGKRANITWENFWTCDTSEYDMVVLYVTQHVVARLEEKLRAELKPGSIVVSNYCDFPSLKPLKHDGRARIYKI